jgi:hypothetical protein
MGDDGPANANKRPSGRLDLRPVQEATTASNRLLRMLATNVFKLFADPSVPREIKVFLAPLLFLVPVYSLVLVIFVGHLIFSLVRGQEPYFLQYLIFVGATLPAGFVLLLGYAAVSTKFENTQTLDLQLQSVTNVRKPRRRTHAE